MSLFYRWKNFNKFLNCAYKLKQIKNVKLINSTIKQKPINFQISKTTKFPLFLISLSIFGSSSDKQKTMASEIIVSEMTEELSDIIRHADQLFDENHYQDVIDLLVKCSYQNLEEVKWRLARAMFKMSKTAEKTKKSELIREAYVLISDALKLNDKNFAVHKWMSVLLDAKSELDGLKERVKQLETVKYHMKMAVELNPQDPTSWYLLGSFAFGLADMPWYQRKIVSAIFATPPDGTYEEALEHFSRAEELKPHFYSMNLLMLGKTHLRLNNKDQAHKYLTEAVKFRVLTEEDKICKEEATELLKKI